MDENQVLVLSAEFFHRRIIFMVAIDHYYLFSHAVEFFEHELQAFLEDCYVACTDKNVRMAFFDQQLYLFERYIREVQVCKGEEFHGGLLFNRRLLKFCPISAFDDNHPNRKG